MLNSQVTEIISPQTLKGRVEDLRSEGYRLAQMCCNKHEGFELTYTFDKNYELINLRLQIPEETEIESISDIYSFAFLYENEMKDLFGVKFKNLLIDFKGNLYKTSIKTPFNPKISD